MAVPRKSGGLHGDGGALGLTIWENVDDLAATVDVEMLAPFAANVDNNVEC